MEPVKCYGASLQGVLFQRKCTDSEALLCAHVQLPPRREGGATKTLENTQDYPIQKNCTDNGALLLAHVWLPFPKKCRASKTLQYQHSGLLHAEWVECCSALDEGCPSWNGCITSKV